MDSVLTVRQVAEQFHVSADVVRRWLNDGKIKGKRVGRSWQISQKAIDKKIKEDSTWEYWHINLYIRDLGLILVGYRGKENVKDYRQFETDMLGEGFEGELPVSFWTKFMDILPEGKPWNDIRKQISKAIEEGRANRKEMKAEEEAHE